MRGTYPVLLSSALMTTLAVTLPELTSADIIASATEATTTTRTTKAAVSRVECYAPSDPDASADCKKGFIDGWYLGRSHCRNRASFNPPAYNPGRSRDWNTGHIIHGYPAGHHSCSTAPPP
jgi:hypothetical protein